MRFLWQKGLIVAFIFVIALLGGCAIQSKFADKLPVTSSTKLSEEREFDYGTVSKAESKDIAAPAESMPAQSPQSKENISKNRSDVAFAAQPTDLVKPQIIKTADLSLEVENIVKSMKSLESITTGFRGIITNQYLSLVEEGSFYRTGTLEARIPEENLEPFLRRLAGVGKILNQQLTGTDVGAEIVDNEARIRNLKVEESALQSIMNRAGKIPDVLSVARELARVRGEIEQLQSRLTYLRQQVAYSTVRISLSEKGIFSPTETKPGVGSVFKNAFDQSIGALYDMLLVIVRIAVWLVVFVLPLILILALLVILLWRLLIKPFFLCCGRTISKAIGKPKEISADSQAESLGGDS